MKTSKIIRTVLTACVALALCLSCLPAAFAAEVADATIDYDAKCSLTIYKYDFTNAEKDGVWNSDSFISTGWRESYVEDILGSTVRTGDTDTDPSGALGNGQNANGYAIKGVEFSYLRVADLVTYSEVTDGVAQIHNLYGFDKTAATDLLAAIGLTDGASRFEAADTSDKLSADCWYYTSDTLNKALYDALTANATTVKNALEEYLRTGGTAMPLTDSDGKSIVRELPVGLYLLVETKVPEMVTSTTNPFFVSLPMTTVSGDDNSASPEGGHQWNYDVVVYPKNSTGIPSMEKTVRESKADGGKHTGTEVITDGYSHNVTASSGDALEFQIISGLPTITSKATGLRSLQWLDTIPAGLRYNKAAKDVRVRIYSDAACENQVADWDMASGKFTVAYGVDDLSMAVEITADGLAEINGDTENVNGALYAGYSNYTARVTYTATVNSDNTFTYGDAANCSKVVFTWQRSSADYIDTLIDDTHVYSYGIDLRKLFSNKDAADAEADGMYKHVKFKIYNETDGCWITASRNDAEGVYYVTGHVAEETDATVFYPVDYNGESGHIVIKGLEDDAYILTELETANGYTLSTDARHVVITTADDAARPCDIYSEDALGVLQNDPRFNFDGGLDLHLAGIPQQALAHNLLSASATVDGRDVVMTEDNALAPLEITNHPIPSIPATGDSGVWMFGVLGLVMSAGIIAFLIVGRRKENAENA